MAARALVDGERVPRRPHPLAPRGAPDQGRSRGHRAPTRPDHPRGLTRMVGRPWRACEGGGPVRGPSDRRRRRPTDAPGQRGPQRCPATVQRSSGARTWGAGRTSHAGLPRRHRDGSQTMEFDWAEEDAMFREELKAFLDHELPVYDEIWDYPALERVAFSRVFCRKLGEAGLLAPHWPVEYGGRGASGWQFIVLGEELWRAGEPRGAQYMNVNWIGPAIMGAGTPEQKDYHLRRITRGDVIWCQGFSEPDGGHRPRRPRRPPPWRRRRVRGQRHQDLDVVRPLGRLLLPAGPHRSRSRGQRGISIFLVPTGIARLHHRARAHGPRRPHRAPTHVRRRAGRPLDAAGGGAPGMGRDPRGARPRAHRRRPVPPRAAGYLDRVRRLGRAAGTARRQQGRRGARGLARAA